MQSVDTKIEHLNNRILPFTSQQVLKDPEVKKALSDLHRNFIIAPIDKATGNISFICKRYYASVLVKELGIEISNHSNDIGTYILEDNISCEAIIQNHSTILKHQFGLDVSEDNQCLPHMYWLPKMHKVPPKQITIYYCNTSLFH